MSTTTMEVYSTQPPTAFDPIAAARRRTSLPLLRTKAVRLNGSHQNLTPPDTPTSPVTQEQQQQQCPEHLFHNYLRAFHAFDPSADDEASSITVSIKQGDLILVHSIHANGWADGTLLTTGARGWLPTNYCEAYDHPHVRNLLNAMTQFWDLLSDGENASFSTFVRQDYVRGLIAGVRYLLEQTNCLHRGAAPVLRHVGVRRMRKGLLADLSSMVQKAKELQEEASQPYAGDVVHIVLDELITKAFKVVTRAVKFVDIWQQETAIALGDGIPLREPPTPPVEDFHPEAEADVEPPLTPHSPKKSSPDKRRLPGDNVDQRPRSAGSALSSREGRKSIGVQRNSITSHRLSLVTEDKTGIMASGQLAHAHDECISLMGQFLGHHMQSRSPTELFDNTQRLVVACTKLLAIMDRVQPLATGRVVSMYQSQLVFKSELDELVQSTKEVFTFSDHPDDEVVILPAQISRVVANGTRLIRAVGECVANTRRLLEKIGDFELPADWSPQPKDLTAPPRAQPRLQDVRHSGKALPMPPIVRQRAMTSEIKASEQLDAAKESRVMSLPNATRYHRPLPRSPASPFTVDHAANSSEERIGLSARKDSVSTSVTELSSSMTSGLRDSEMMAMSQISTRATTPDHSLGAAEQKEVNSGNGNLLTSFASVSSMASAGTDASHTDVAESQLLHKTYAHELVLNQQGQVAGGSLPALVEQLTSHDTTPDPTFATSFLLTFRLFTTAKDLAEALVDRFEYMGESKTVGVPVRLRVCNFFKSWLENYWNTDADKLALPIIREFALYKVKQHLPSAADRLLEAVARRSTDSGHHNSHTTANNSPFVSFNGLPSPTGLMRAMTFGAALSDNSTTPELAVSKAQLNLIRRGDLVGSDCNIIDIDALEIARQLTLMASRIYCSIQADELLSLAWNKKGSNKATNVRQLSKLNTDLSFMVGESILAQDEAKKRAIVIKQWVKVATHCLTLRNFESLFSIVASLMCSYISRMRKTWEAVPKKTKVRFEELKQAVDPSGNNAAYRRQIDEALAPCVPFLAIHLTHLTFSDAGNPATRPLPNTWTPAGEAVTVVNFSKYTQMTKVVHLVQRFQAPYNLQSCTELQNWLEMNLSRQLEPTEELEKALMARSHLLEARQVSMHHPPNKSGSGTTFSFTVLEERPKTAAGDERRSDHGVKELNFFTKHSAFSLKSALVKSEASQLERQHDVAVEGASRL